MSQKVNVELIIQEYLNLFHYSLKSRFSIFLGINFENLLSYLKLCVYSKLKADINLAGCYKHTSVEKQNVLLASWIWVYKCCDYFLLISCWWHTDSSATYLAQSCSQTIQKPIEIYTQNFILIGLAAKEELGEKNSRTDEL